MKQLGRLFFWLAERCGYDFATVFGYPKGNVVTVQWDGRNRQYYARVVCVNDVKRFMLYATASPKWELFAPALRDLVNTECRKGE